MSRDLGKIEVTVQKAVWRVFQIGNTIYFVAQRVRK